MSRNKFTERRLFFYFLFVGTTLLLLITLFGIQVLNDSYKVSAENNVIKSITIYPERGYIYDREGVLLVTNQRAYDLMVTPRQIKRLDTIALCEIIDIDLEEFNKYLKRAKRYSTRKASLLLKEISKQTAAQLQERGRLRRSDVQGGGHQRAVAGRGRDRPAGNGETTWREWGKSGERRRGM